MFRYATMLCAILCTLAAWAESTAFTYQGALRNGDAPVTGTYDLQFTLTTADSGGNTINTITMADMPVTQGLFTVQLDFGAAPFDGTDRWLEIAVRPGDETGAYTVLTPRLKFMPTPYAIFAASVPWSGITGKPTLNGSGWSLTGNAGTDPATNFLGTTDTTALEFRVGNLRALRLQPHASGNNLIGGYPENTAGVNAYSGVICGGGTAGYPNTINNPYAAILGGYGNTAGGIGSAVLNGNQNTAGGLNAIAGGDHCQATAPFAIALGNTNIASGNSAFARGSFCTANGSYSTAMGMTAYTKGLGSVAIGYNVTADADYAVALGFHANANTRYGSFTFADASSTSDVTAPANNAFTVRAAGGVKLYTNAGLTTGSYLSAGGSGWNNVSDRNAKTAFTAIDTREVLRKVATLPMTTWQYKSQQGVTHLGPVAQDFHAAFGLGENDVTINSIDADGVALAAIQGLQQELQAHDAENAALQARVSDLEARLAALEALLKK